MTVKDGAAVTRDPSATTPTDFTFTDGGGATSRGKLLQSALGKVRGSFGTGFRN